MGVARARSEEDVAETVRVCAQSGLPVTVRSGGTGLAGQSIGPGLVLDVGHLEPWVRVLAEGREVSASASATVDSVNQALKPFGRRLGPDLTSSDRARVGGMVATNACGAGSNDFGRAAEGIVSAEVITGMGTRRELRKKSGSSPKDHPLLRSGAGYASEDPESPAAVCGSEGTLAVVMSATFRTYPVRPAAVGILAFDDLRDATRAVPEVLAAQPHAVELMDRLALRARWPEDPAAVLVVEMHGGTMEEAEARFWDLRPAKAIVGTGPDASAREAAWRLRRSVLADLRPRDGRRPVALIEDACVPVNRLDELAGKMLKIASRTDVELVVYGHAGAGTLHLRPLLDLRREEHRRAAVALIADHADVVLSLGGTLSSEHGLGLARTWLIERELSAERLSAWRALKAEFDPAGILNPGRVVPDRETFPAELLAY